VTYVIAELCIHVKDRACVPECPVSAIFPEDEVPVEWTSYIAKSREVFRSDSPPAAPRR
jgi:ferredoxin